MLDDFGLKRVQVFDPGFLLVQNIGKIVFYDNSSGSSVNNEEPAVYDNCDGTKEKVKQWFIGITL